LSIPNISNYYFFKLFLSTFKKGGAKLKKLIWLKLFKYRIVSTFLKGHKRSGGFGSTFFKGGSRELHSILQFVPVSNFPGNPHENVSPYFLYVPLVLTPYLDTLFYILEELYYPYYCSMYNSFR